MPENEISGILKTNARVLAQERLAIALSIALLASGLLASILVALKLAGVFEVVDALFYAGLCFAALAIPAGVAKAIARISRPREYSVARISDERLRFAASDLTTIAEKSSRKFDVEFIALLENRVESRAETYLISHDENVLAPARRRFKIVYIVFGVLIAMTAFDVLSKRSVARDLISLANEFDPEAGNPRSGAGNPDVFDPPPSASAGNPPPEQAPTPEENAPDENPEEPRENDPPPGANAAGPAIQEAQREDDSQDQSSGGEQPQNQDETQNSGGGQEPPEPEEPFDINVTPQEGEGSEFIERMMQQLRPGANDEPNVHSANSREAYQRYIDEKYNRALRSNAVPAQHRSLVNDYFDFLRSRRESETSGD
ncbi:MAG: hypothetical protein NUW37_18695 [Planctomycetes bacterium]|nr:hypothetical protein [Planctomycetota bacterium]